MTDYCLSEWSLILSWMISYILSDLYPHSHEHTSINTTETICKSLQNQLGMQYQWQMAIHQSAIATSTVTLASEASWLPQQDTRNVGYCSNTICNDKNANGTFKTLFKWPLLYGYYIQEVRMKWIQFQSKQMHQWGPRCHTKTVAFAL